MPYTKQTWIDSNASYPLSAARMGNIEDGIAAATALADSGGTVIDVTAAPYNAPTNGTDATSAFNAARDALNALGGGIIHVPKGTYGLRRFELNKNNVYLRVTPGATIRMPTTFSVGVNDDYCILLGTPYSNFSASTRVNRTGILGTINFDLSAIGNRAAQNGKQTHCIGMYNVEDFVIGDIIANGLPYGCATFWAQNGAGIGAQRGRVGRVEQWAPYGFGPAQMTHGREIFIEALVTDDWFALSIEQDYGAPSGANAYSNQLVEDIVVGQAIMRRASTSATNGLEDLIKIMPYSGATVRRVRILSGYVSNAPLLQLNASSGGNIGNISIENVVSEGNSNVAYMGWLPTSTWTQTGPIVLKDCTFKGGTADGILQQKGNLILQNCVITGNGGYGIQIASGLTTTAIASDLSGNTSGRKGGSGTLTEAAAIA